MRVSPISILSNRSNIAQNSIFFLSGNEITLIEKIKISIIDHFKNKGSFVINKIKNIEECRFEKSLFEKNNIYCQWFMERAMRFELTTFTLAR